MINISKELLSEVMCIDKISKDTIRQYRNYVQFYSDGEDYSINIHELSHKCKEWAHQKGFLLDSRTTHCGSCFLLSSPFVYDQEIRKPFLAKTEKQAVFNACQWILENKEKIR